LAVAAALVGGCSADDRLAQHASKIRSSRATTIAVAEAWLHGDVSAVYAQTALEQTFQLVEQERAAVAATPQDLAKPDAGSLTRDAEELSRELAAMSRDVQTADGATLRRRLSELEAATPQQP
jgi:hypothetical protein